MANKTENFKEHIQKIIGDTLGIGVSKEQAWKLFKNIEKGTMQFVAFDDDNKLPLAGVGTYEITFSKPTGKKAGLVKNESGEEVKDDTLEVWKYIPRYKIRTSSSIKNDLYSIFNCPGCDKEVELLGSFKKETEKVEEKEDTTKSELLKEEVTSKVDVDDLF